ncbi:MAG: hypothetical protein Q4F65_09400, partial [Propionibacteriaceae bacterium]|nr:hypothetical protein [Propionibacteriaceae bacterium]
MTAWTYHHTPGDLVGFASGPLLALVALDPSDALVGQLAERVADGDATLDGVLDLLVSRGLRAIDSFGLAEVTPDGVRVLVRG